MGSFKQHITCSTITGVCLGGIAYQFGFSIPVCLLSAGLCSMAGMLPDIDSDSSRSFQECIYFAAGLCAVLLVDRLKLFGIDRDTILLAGAAMFMFVRFGVGNMIKRITAHRGMFHSIPAAVFAGQIVFFLSSGSIEDRLCKSAALVAGYLSHLILDEICSIDSTGQSLRFKKSFGTALKFYDPKRLGTSLALYAVIIGFTAFSVKNPNPIDSGESLENRIRLALEDSLEDVPLKQQDITSLIAFIKKKIPSSEAVKNTIQNTIQEDLSTVPEVAAAVIVSVPAVKKAATLQEQMHYDIPDRADYERTNAIADERANETAGDVNYLTGGLHLPLIEAASHAETAALPFEIPQQTAQAAPLPFDIPSNTAVNTAVNTAPQLPFSLPF
ncbi:hypothetical protein FACS18942_06590 [Planctomycetales bacterium]|nr:hypothetical protein FACS18942_06590 [Planctomycetales bacterium]